jgi:hypothetical protein
LRHPVLAKVICLPLSVRVAHKISQKLQAQSTKTFYGRKLQLLWQYNHNL